MQFFDSIIARARSRPQTIVLAEGEDARVMRAAQRARDDGIAACVLLGREAETAFMNQIKRILARPKSHNRRFAFFKLTALSITVLRTDGLQNSSHL